jgi:aldehyde dehydrogenase (NAD(P)+)
VLPGKWTRADLRFQAEHVATQRLHNGGYNCIASQVLIVSSDWPQREAFLTELRRALTRAPGRAGYYPGSDQRAASAMTSYPDAERLGADGGRILVTNVDVGERNALLGTEYFAPVFGVLEMSGLGIDYLNAAVDTANDSISGTLGINIIADPRTLRELGAGLDWALTRLRYGTVAVNAWTGFGYLTAAASWGAFPGHEIGDVQSGIGVVHNALLLDGPERTVIRGPFRPTPRALLHGGFTLSPKPPWFVTNRTGTKTARLLTAFAGRPSWAKLPAIFVSALRG